MKRYFFLADNLEKLEAIEHDLEHNGLSRPQVHVLSHDDSGVHQHQLNDIEAVLRKDVVHSMQRGALFGFLGLAIVLGAAHFSGAAAAVGWVPFVFLGIVVLGFMTWEGGLFGIQEPHRDFKRFEQALESGRHLLIIDATDKEQNLLNRVTAHYPELEFSGTAEGAPGWFINLQNKWRNFIEVMP